METELGLGSQERLFLALQLLGEGDFPKGVLTSKSLFQIQNLTLLGRKEQDGSVCNV